METETLNEELIETEAEEIAEVTSNGSFKMAAGLGIGILAGVALCKLAKPVITKIKNRKKAKDDVVDSELVEEAEVEGEQKQSK